MWPFDWWPQNSCSLQIQGNYLFILNWLCCWLDKKPQTLLDQDTLRGRSLNQIISWKLSAGDTKLNFILFNETCTFLTELFFCTNPKPTKKNPTGFLLRKPGFGSELVNQKASSIWHFFYLKRQRENNVTFVWTARYHVYQTKSNQIYKGDDVFTACFPVAKINQFMPI